MKIAIASDHAALALRGELRDWLSAAGHTVEDLGTHDTASVDYPDFAQRVAGKVASGEADRGVLICGTGQGMAIAANKVRGVRAAVVADPFSARMAMQHNDARILCLGARIIGASLAIECLAAWVDAAFEGGRHARRVGKIGDLEERASAAAPR